VRQRDALEKCVVALMRFAENESAGSAQEIRAVDLRDALHAIGDITGETTPDEVLDRIFERFCVGK
jgi:tRNA modification GTPase